jgi:sulfur carrier protein
VIVTLNGEPREVADGATVEALVGLLSPGAGAGAGGGAGGRGVAVALGGEVVPRGRWAETEVADGDRVEVVAAIQGG